MTTTPNLGLTQYAGTDTMNFLTQYNTDLDKIDDYSVATNTNIGALASLKTEVKTSTVGAINEVYDTTDNGWISARATLTYASANAPTFVCNTSIDLTTRISVGMKIKLMQSSVNKYFFVTAITSTTITLYGGATYSVINSAISNVYFSSVQLPYGFPIAKDGLGVDFIIERGSNANGNYEKWNSGKLVMWGKIVGVSITFAHQVAGTPFYVNDTLNITLPFTPVTTTYSNMDVIGNGYSWSTRSSVTGSSLAYTVIQSTNVTTSHNVSWIVKGTWK